MVMSRVIHEDVPGNSGSSGHGDGDGRPAASRGYSRHNILVMPERNDKSALGLGFSFFLGIFFFNFDEKVSFF